MIREMQGSEHPDIIPVRKVSCGLLASGNTLAIGYGKRSWRVERGGFGTALSFGGWRARRKLEVFGAAGGPADEWC